MTVIKKTTAILLKSKNFNYEWTNDYYMAQDEDLHYETYGVKGSDTHEWIYPAPAQSTVQKWLRERHDIHIEIPRGYYPKTYHCFVYDHIYDGNIPNLIKEFNSYEEALEEGILIALNSI